MMESSGNINQQRFNDLKQEADKYFKSKDYNKAIFFYGKAAKASPSNPIPLFNMALCSKFLHNFKQAEIYSQMALNLNPEYLKAIIVHGVSLCELGKFDITIDRINKGIQELNRALLFAIEDNQFQIQEQIQAHLKVANKLAWYKNKEIKVNQELFLTSKLDFLLMKQREQGNIDQQKFLKLRNVNMKFYQEKEQEIKQQAEIPDYLICKITLDFMENPAVTCQGFTYDRSILQEHFKINGYTDPVSRANIPTHLFFNRNIKEATTYFLKNNAWAVGGKSYPCETYEDIKFT